MLNSKNSPQSMNSREWELFAPHRNKVTGLLVEDVPPGAGRLCVLGAGTCNDLDLKFLTSFFREVHLVDIDGQALESGVSFQAADRSVIKLHGGIDLTGAAEDFAKLSEKVTPSKDEIDRCIQKAAEFPGPGLPGPFEVATSVCLVSQLVNTIVLSVGERHPMFIEAMKTIRDRHLRLLAEMVSPGGWGILVTDIVSSDTVPELAYIPESELAELVTDRVSKQDFFHGCNPFVLESIFRTYREPGPKLARLYTVRPWRWNTGRRIYAVCATKFQRK